MFYIPSNKLTLSTTILNQKISTVLIKINKELEYENNLTLALDGWSNSLEKSIYAFVVITPSRKQYIYALIDESSQSHTDNKTEEFNLDDLLITEMIDLNSYNINNIENTLTLNNNIEQESESKKNSDIDFESIYNEEFY
ncbi:20171_t:CDS:2 [Cetraspora pellucida]|uniref:20171_t:CDS:1 n=1 Tax=Cetraspora pellucida TaxID=1433469 RepID=A0A9N9NJ28_9GLOM|nr:20171_t:CDS:2 [Cetraspora pellucida]